MLNSTAESTSLRIKAEGHSLSRWAFSALIIGALCIAFSPILVRLSELPPTATAFHRVFLALPFFLAWNAMGAHRNFSGLGKERKPSPIAPNTGGTETRPGRSVFWAAAAGLFFAGDLAFWHWSINYTSVANATLLANLAPVFVTLIAWLLFGEHITGRFLAGMIIAILGTSLLVRASVGLSGQHLLGDLLGTITAVFYAGYMLSMKQLRRTSSTPQAMGMSTGFTAVVLLGLVLVTQEPLLAPTYRGWLILLGLALVSQTIGQGLIAYGLAHLPASFSSVTLLIQPAAAALLAWVILAEPLTWWQAAGGALVIVGIRITRRASTQAVAELRPAR